jgi:hypothetical protein
MGPCAKTKVKCTIVTSDGDHVVGENWCLNPQETCPRNEGEDYTKCKTVCRQLGHAEDLAVRIAGDNAKGGRAYLEGHNYACQNCQIALFGAGVKSLSIGPPEANK